MPAIWAMARPSGQLSSAGGSGAGASGWAAQGAESRRGLDTSAGADGCKAPAVDSATSEFTPAEGGPYSTAACARPSRPCCAGHWPPQGRAAGSSPWRGGRLPGPRSAA